MSTRTGGRSRLRVYSVRDGAFSQRLDELATEEPLEIRLEAGGKTVPLAVTMRTPGDDYELVAGYLYSEGVVQSRADLPGLSHCIDPTVDAEQRHNIVNARLRPGLTADLRRLDRHVFQSSACGVCGKASLEQLETRACPAPVLGRPVPYEVILELPAKLRAAQGLFAATGGLHAAGLFSATGELLAAREDVGRHNAVDKLVGWALLNDRLPLSDQILLVSGRARYEVNRVILPPAEEQGADGEPVLTTEVRLCESCGYLHPSDHMHHERCERCDAPLPSSQPDCVPE